MIKKIIIFVTSFLTKRLRSGCDIWTFWCHYQFVVLAFSAGIFGSKMIQKGGLSFSSMKFFEFVFHDNNICMSLIFRLNYLVKRRHALSKVWFRKITPTAITIDFVCVQSVSN